MKMFSCQDNGCGRTYANPYNLKRHHTLKHLKLKCFKCYLCKQELSSMQNLREHESMHRGEKLYKCYMCGIRFRYCSQLSNHKRLHLQRTGTESFKELKLTDLLRSVKDREIFMKRHLEDDEYLR